MIMTRILVLFMMAVMLAACSELKYYSDSGFAPVIDCGSGVKNWLVELHETRAMPPEMLQQTRDAWEQEYRKDPSLNNRMRLVLLLASGEDQARDNERARQMLQELDLPAINESEQEFVSLLLQYIDEQDQSHDRINNLTQQVTRQSQRIDELEQQLRALTVIEQNIQQREKSGGD
jgi:allophanate hydrolase subunit 1